jgi:hypothetical protein
MKSADAYLGPKIMAKTSKQALEKAIEISGVDADGFKKLDAEDRAKYLQEAAELLGQEYPSDGSQDSQTIHFVNMKRDTDAYPEPHTAQVHPDEVENYQLGGWVHAE